MKVTVVDFNMYGDGRTAVYLDGKKIKEGDDKIEQFVEGFYFALKTLKIDYTFDYIIGAEENKTAWGIYEDGDDIPEELQDFESKSV